MLFSVNEVLENHKSGSCKVKAYFYAVGGSEPKAFISDNEEEQDGNIILLPVSVINDVIEQDETFGILVGSIYAYYAMDAIIDGDINFNGNQAFFSKVREIVLSDNGSSQSFYF